MGAFLGGGSFEGRFRGLSRQGARTQRVATTIPEGVTTTIPEGHHNEGIAAGAAASARLWRASAQSWLAEGCNPPDILPIFHRPDAAAVA